MSHEPCSPTKLNTNEIIPQYGFLTPYRPKNPTSRDPYTPSSRNPPSGRPAPPSVLHLFEKGQGARSPSSRGGPGSWLSRTVGGLTVGIPRAGSTPTSRDPLPLLKIWLCNAGVIMYVTLHALEGLHSLPCFLDVRSLFCSEGFSLPFWVWAVVSPFFTCFVRLAKGKMAPMRSYWTQVSPLGLTEESLSLVTSSLNIQIDRA